MWRLKIIVLFILAMACCLLSMRPLMAVPPGYQPQHLPGGTAQIPSSILNAIRVVKTGMTRAEFDRLFTPYLGAFTSDEGVVSGINDDSPSRRTNPQIFYYRKAYVPSVFPVLGFKPDTQHWVFKQSPGFGTLVMLDVTWKYSNHYHRSQYHYVRSLGRTLLIAPVYDGVAGGSPDDVITHVSHPYLIYDAGMRA